ncbi:MAG: DUF502 domain-containing protein [Sulfitobacter sp.]|nr:DUF502 domain-containing protein [Sulfitobacter sp.]
MKGLFSFIKTTLAGGFFVVLPMMLIYMMLGETLEAATALAQPIVDLLPEGFMEGTRFPNLLAVVLIVLVSLLFGLVLRTSWGRVTIQKAERAILEKIPGYSTIRSLSKSVAGDHIKGQFEPALLSMPMDGKVLVFVVERHDDGRFTVFLPSSPTPGVGTIQVVPAERVHLLDASAAQVFEALSHWGVGTRDALTKS